MHTDYMHKGLSKTPTTGNQGVLAVPSYNARVVSKEKWLEGRGEQGRGEAIPIHSTHYNSHRLLRCVASCDGARLWTTMCVHNIVSKKREGRVSYDRLAVKWNF